MKSKGFTLIEVMAIVIIIAAIALVSFPVLTSVMKNNAKLEEDTFKENAIEAAKTYCNLNKSYDEEGNCSVDISKLIEESYLDKPTDDDYNYAKQVVDCDTEGKCNYHFVSYQLGEEIVLKNEKYNVIGQGDDYVTLLKQTPLTVEEVNLYGGVGTENNHVNKKTYNSVRRAYDTKGYGGLAYYSSSTCGYKSPGVISYIVISGCESEGATDYNNSDIKYVIDNWEKDKFSNGYLKEVEGYKARLVQKEELRRQFYPNCSSTALNCYPESTTPSWIYAPNYEYTYWTMTLYPSNYAPLVWYMNNNGVFDQRYVTGTDVVVRPVINVYKSVLD